MAPRLAHQCDYMCVSQLDVERTGRTRYADVDVVVSVTGNADPKGQWEHVNGMTVQKKRKEKLMFLSFSMNRYVYILKACRP